MSLQTSLFFPLGPRAPSLIVNPPLLTDNLVSDFWFESDLLSSSSSSYGIYLRILLLSIFTTYPRLWKLMILNISITDGGLEHCRTSK